MLSKKRSTVSAFIIIVVCCLTLVILSAKLYLPGGFPNVTEWRPKPGAEVNPTSLPPQATGTTSPEVLETAAPQVHVTTTPQPQVDVTSSSQALETAKPQALPLGYYETKDDDEMCSRYSPTYLQDFLDHTASYCSPESPAKLTCFHRDSGFEYKTDSFCYAQGATLDVQKGKLQLDCALREFSEEEMNSGLLPFSRLPLYWYETGPAAIFLTAVDVKPSKGSRAIDAPAESYEPRQSEPEYSSLSIKDDTKSSVKPPKTLLLLKREGEGNPWHCLMEIFSTFMTFDILRMPGGPSGDQPPIFKDPIDADDTQVVILDDRGDGPYFDLWTLYARRKPLRLAELMADQAMVKNLDSVNLIIPLTGSSNPLWKDDDQAEQCTNSQTLNVFSRRVLDFYGVKSPSLRGSEKPILLTFVWRQENRRMKNEDTLLAELARRNPRVTVQMIDFAILPFSEQVRIAQESDLLVGIHGAGLTHSMFMRQGASAMVEIQPSGFDHRGFRNVASMRKLGYFRTHAKIIRSDAWIPGEIDPTLNMHRVNNVTLAKLERQNRREIHRIETAKRSEKLQRREEWHFNDIEIEAEKFFEVVESAIKYMYAKGPWTVDIN